VFDNGEQVLGSTRSDPPVAAHVPRTRTLAATIPNLRCRRMIRSSDEPALAASCQLGEDIA
jgi:hypothetical protein